MLLAKRRVEFIEFSTKDGLVLQGHLTKRINTNTTCLLYIHGMAGNFYRSMLPTTIADKMARKGTGVFTFNNRGHDVVSFTGRPGKSRMEATGTFSEDFAKSIYDIKGAINAMEKLGFKRFILVGHSTGCQKIAYYQYKTADPHVLGLVHLAPGDDYNIWRRDLGKRFNKAVAKARRLVRQKKGHRPLEGTDFSAKRFLSVADPRNAEARIFNYDGPLNEFSIITVPQLVLFGSKEEYAVKPVRRYLDILKAKAHSPYAAVIVKGAKHSFRGHEDEVADSVAKWSAAILR